MKGTGTKSKVIGILILLTVLCVFIVGRVGYIKAVHGNDYEIRAKNQQTNRYDVVTNANRGMIVDRNGLTMAVSTTVYNIVLDPLVLYENDEKEQEKTLTALSETLGLDYDTMKQYITVNPDAENEGELYRNNHWTVLKKKVDRATAESLMEQNLKGVVYDKDSEREYPLNTLAANVLGFVRGDSKWGLENQYDAEMTGTPGRSFVMYDGSGNVVSQEIAAIDGNTVVTTIDSTLQQFAEQTAYDVLNSYTGETVGVIIMNPNTGEIYAMAQAETYNPNDPTTPLEVAKDVAENGEDGSVLKLEWDSLSEEEQMTYLYKVWKNFCVSTSFEPGSIFKPITVAAALEENIISTEDTFYCNGYRDVWDYTIKCWNVHGHGVVNVEQSLANSCNCAMMDIVARMGKYVFYKYQKDFGIGERTGIDLPGELSAASLMYSVRDIGPVELATESFGQSFNVTAIQAVVALSAVINGGNIMKPYVVSQVIDKDGNIVSENKPEVLRKVISQETSDTVRRYLQATMEYGTGYKAGIEGYAIGGKTGTGQQGKRNEWIHTLSFATFLPVEDPQVLCFIVMDKDPNYIDGITTLTPAMKTLMLNVIQYMGISPTNAEENQAAIYNNTANKVTVGNYIGMKSEDAVWTLEQTGLKYDVVGTGQTVYNQAPAEGTPVDAGSLVILYVEKGEGDPDDLIQVPDVTNLSYDEAVSKLLDVGLYPVVKGPEMGTVTEQSPRAGLSVEKESDIIIWISE
ncbi:MAG: PASTA domain-containing protein [Firmicutes bacterium]|nr:PASTA domain-containing protein [Bacillota bacterium]